MNRIMRNLSSSQERYIDSRIAIRPSQCYAWGNFDDGTPTIVTVPFDWWNNTLFEQSIPASSQENLKPMIDPWKPFDDGFWGKSSVASYQ